MGPAHRAPPSRQAPVITVNGHVLAAGLRRDPNPSPQLALRIPGVELPQGVVVLQVTTTEGPVLLEARANPDRRPGVVRCELTAIEPSLRKWLEAQLS